jgi:hypothetical protein
MKRRKYRKYALKDNTVFEPIVYDKSSFNLRNKLDLFATTVELDDYDWMSYKLKAWLPTKAYGDIVIDFVYNGTSPCTMIIETKRKKYRFYFAIELFQEHIIKFLQKHIKHWDDKYAFSGKEEAVNFYNAVITHPKTESEDIETITREEALKRMAARRQKDMPQE